MATKLLAAIIFCFLSISTSSAALHSSGQGYKIVDSLLHNYQTSPSPQIKFDALVALAGYYEYQAPDSNRYYGYMALKLAREQANQSNEVSAHNALIDGFLRKWQTDSVWAHMMAVRNIIKAAGNKELSCTELYYFGGVYESLHKRDSSLYCYLQAKEYAGHITNNIIKALVFHGISQYYMRQREYDKALPYCLTAYRLRENKDTFEHTGLLSDLGNIYYWKKEYDTAMRYYQECLHDCITKNVWWAYGFTYNNIGLVNMAQNKLPDAILDFKDAIRYYSIYHNHDGLANTGSNLARLYYQQNAYDSALAYALFARNQAQNSSSDYKVMFDIYNLLSKIYESTGDYKNALLYERNSARYKDSVHNAEDLIRTTDLQIKYETSQKDIENKKLREKEAIQEELSSKQTVFAIFISLLFCLTLFFLYQISRKNREHQKLNREIILQKKELEETNEFKTKLFSIISHDFRGPLTTLNGFLYLIQEDMLDKSELLSISRSMLDQLNTTSAFLDNMLYWAQSQLNGYNPFIHRVNVKLVVVEVFELYQNAANAKGLTLQNDVDGKIEIEADANMVRLVLRNLINNAIKFSSSGSIHVSCKKEVDQWIISVTDSGMGIPPEIRDRLFSGSRFSSEGTRAERGTGLGLALCKDFVEASGGKIWVESGENKGSTFSFSIPVRP